MQKIAAFIVKKRKLLLAVMLILAVVCAALMPFVGVNTDMTKYLPDVPGYAYIYVNGFSAGDYLVAGGEKLTLEGWHSLTAPEKSAAAS